MGRPYSSAKKVPLRGKFGQPIVVTDVPDCREIVRTGVNALLVPPDAPRALADAIAQLARNRDLRRRFTLAGRQLVEREFSGAWIGQQIVAFYDGRLNRSPSLLPQGVAGG